ncbi:MAG: MarR family transcriptional regulator [Elusimicrobia bacterium]|nr:MarR family transcriptional regulator [Elusimicrobiota bacterium]
MNSRSLSAEAHGTECTSLKLRMASRALTQVYDEVFRPLGIKSTQFSLLRMIQHHGPITFQGLAEKMVLDQTTLPRSLRTIEKDGYILIERGEDRRERLVSITSKGTAALERAVPLWQKAQGLVRAKFQGERLDQLMADLDRLRRVIAE